MMRSEQVNELAGALAKAQSKIVNPSKNKSVSVRTKSGGTYDFSYADLAGIYDAIRGPLTDNGLWPIQTLEMGENQRYKLVTTLLHSSGQFISSETPLLIEEAGNQKFGSALTFMRRYALCALIGVAADNDDDANAADGNEVKPLWSPNVVKPPRPADAPPVEPHLITLHKTGPGLTDWIGFGKELLDHLKAAKDLEVFEKWTAENQKNVDRMAEVAATAYDRLEAAIASQRERFM